MTVFPHRTGKERWYKLQTPAVVSFSVVASFVTRCYLHTYVYIHTYILSTVKYCNVSAYLFHSSPSL